MTQRSPADDYTDKVRGEIRVLRGYFARQLTWYRTLRTVVIVSAGAVPVLAAISSVPRWTLGLLGALAVMAEGFQQLYQFRLSALNAVKTANELERELNLYLLAAPPYATIASDAFPRFAAKVEEIRREADRAILETWQRATPDVRVEPPKP